MEQILNNYIESGDLIIQIVQVMHIHYKWITEVLHYISHLAALIYLGGQAVLTCLCEQGALICLSDQAILTCLCEQGALICLSDQAVLICLSDGSFIGPGGRDILNDQPSLASGVKNTLETKLETKLEQNPILEQKTKEKEKEKPKNNIVLKIVKSSNRYIVRNGQPTATVLYEKLDVNSTTILTLTRPHPNNISTGIWGHPSTYRTGIHLDTISPNGTYTSPEFTRWPVNGLWHSGFVCPAIRHPDPDIKFVDEFGRDIAYNGNSMLIPYGDTGRLRRG